MKRNVFLLVLVLILSMAVFAEPTDLLGAESPMFLCHDSSAKKYSGYITSFRVYNRALDEDEILHNATLEQAITPVVAE